MVVDRVFKEMVRVRFSKREDGGLRAQCDEVPGFHLSGLDQRAVMADVVPALETLIDANFGIKVSAKPLKYGIYSVEEKAFEESIPEVVDYAIDRKAA